MISRVYLWGLPGVGKSSFGLELANNLGWDFVDLDLQIEEKLGKTITTIFEEFGEDVFRKLESEVLKETVFSSNVVVACGGGTPCFFNNLEWMNWNGMSVYLIRDLDDIVQSIYAEKGKRPYFKGLEKPDIRLKLEELLTKRGDFYQKAKIIGPTNQHLVNLLSAESE